MGGHHFACALHGTNWWRLSDNHVEKISAEKAFQSSPTVTTLFFTEYAATEKELSLHNEHLTARKSSSQQVVTVDDVVDLQLNAAVIDSQKRSAF